MGSDPGTEHFRNLRRHQVEIDPAVLQVRIDESLTFINARALEDWILNRITGSPVRHVVLVCSAINEINFSALETLEQLDHRLREASITLHLSEVKGPVVDRFARTQFHDQLAGQVFLSQHDAFRALCDAGPEAGARAAAE